MASLSTGGSGAFTNSKLEQVYLSIGSLHEQILVHLNLPLLDPSACMDQEIIFRLALVTAFQIAEGLPDTAAAVAVQTRQDWRTALRLPGVDPGISASALCRFRESMVFSAEALHEFNQLLSHLEMIGLYAILPKTTTNPSQAISRVCQITCFSQLVHAIKSALSSLVTVHPEWFRANALPHWYERYKTKLLNQPILLSEEELRDEAAHLGKDIQHLLTVRGEQERLEWGEQPELQLVARLFREEFIISGENIVWRLPVCTACPCNQRGFTGSNLPP